MNIKIEQMSGKITFELKVNYNRRQLPGQPSTVGIQYLP